MTPRKCHCGTRAPWLFLIVGHDPAREDRHRDGRAACDDHMAIAARELIDGQDQPRTAYSVLLRGPDPAATATS